MWVRVTVRVEPQPVATRAVSSTVAIVMRDANLAFRRSRLFRSMIVVTPGPDRMVA